MFMRPYARIPKKLIPINSSKEATSKDVQTSKTKQYTM
jgi:hypothetical protein